MSRRTTFIIAAAALVLTSAALYFVHYLIWKDPHHIFIYLVGDIAFVPVEVLMVALVIERMLHHHEKRQLLQKLNMVIGTFFGELGTRLLGELSTCLEERETVCQSLGVGLGWSQADFRRAESFAAAFDFHVDVQRADLAGLRDFLNAKRDFLLLLLANPNLLEHDRFTDLLLAVVHLMDELLARESLTDLPETDARHVAGDLNRVYARLAREWVHYCRHLKRHYPYIYSIVARTHPLQPEPCATVGA